MAYRIKIQDIELSRPIQDITGLDGYHFLQGIVRLYGTPIASVRVSVTDGCCSASSILKIILEQYSWPIIRYLLTEQLKSPVTPEKMRVEQLVNLQPAMSSEPTPLVTVAVCTRDRADNLVMCLNSLMQLDYPALDIVIVDNAPSTTATEELVRQYPNARYVCEPRPGLDWARNRAIIEAKGKIIAYTDDDVVVDSGWVKGFVPIFAENPQVMCVTGLTVPYEIETEAQYLLELYGGFGRGFERKWYDINIVGGEEAGFTYGGAGRYGAGANMAFRRCIFERIGYFDPALDVGTVTNGGGDLEIFFRVLKEGYTLVYEPAMLVRHRHRREYAQLWKQIHNNGIGLYSYFARSAMHYPDARAGFRKLGFYWLRWWNIRRFLISLFRPTLFPRDLIWAELKGSFIGLRRYQQARKRAAEIEAKFGAQVAKSDHQLTASPDTSPQELSAGSAMLTVDLMQPMPEWTDCRRYAMTRVLVTLGSKLVGMVEIANKYRPLSSMRVRQAIVDQLGLNLIAAPIDGNHSLLWSEISVALATRFKGAEEETVARIPDDVSVSVVVGTYDRPHDLEECLRCLTSQDTRRPVEIIVADNHPESGMTPPVVAKFPGVVLVSEGRKGASFARNTGILAASGEIIVTTDDDIIMPPYWLENLLAPLARADVMMVTGNFMPPELETPAQQLFAQYDGMGRGHTRYEVSGNWFESYRRRAVPTWYLGGTGNAAYRAELFRDSRIGLMEERLGAGVPTGTGEDIYFFYKVLKAGYTIAYEPSAYVWHKYRREMTALYRQVYNYSKGHVAYHLMTIYRDGDFRGLVQLLYVLPKWRIQQLFQWMRGKSQYPLKFILLEIKGNLIGPWALWQATRHVRRAGRTPGIINHIQT
jgi:glycosyltransferase involved in cell wall biosynthesis